MSRPHKFSNNNAVVDIRNTGAREGHFTVEISLEGIVQKTFSTATDLGRTLSGGEQIFLSVNVNGNAGDRFDAVITSDEGEISQSTIDTALRNRISFQGA